MSLFEKLKEEDLRKIAEEFGVEVTAKDKPAELVRAIEEDGVTPEMVAKTIPGLATDLEAAVESVKADVAAEKAKEPQILLRMDRANSRYDVRGVTFTRDNPFALMAESDALWVIKNVEGIRRADPEEAAEYYR